MKTFIRKKRFDFITMSQFFVTIMPMVSDVLRHFPLGGGILTSWPTIVAKEKVTETTVANSLAVWLTFDQLFYKFESIGCGVTPHAPFGTSLSLVVGDLPN